MNISLVIFERLLVPHLDTSTHIGVIRTHFCRRDFAIESNHAHFVCIEALSFLPYIMHNMQMQSQKKFYAIWHIAIKRITRWVCVFTTETIGKWRGRQTTTTEKNCRLKIGSRDINSIQIVSWNQFSKYCVICIRSSKLSIRTQSNMIEIRFFCCSRQFKKI